MLLLPLVLWRLTTPLPSLRPLLVVGNRVYHPGEEVLLLEGVPYPLKVMMKGGLLALGEAPGHYKGPGTRGVFCQSNGFALRGPWGEGGCFVVQRKVKWKGPFQPYPGMEGGYLLVVPWFGRDRLEVEVTKEWLCDVRTGSGGRIQRVKEKARGTFFLRVLEAREAWYKTLYITAWGVEAQGLRAPLNHLHFLLNLMEGQILKGQEGMVRLNLLAWRDALAGLKDRLEVLAREGEPVGVWLRLLPSWRAWPRIEAAEEKTRRTYPCWRVWLGLVGMRGGGPMAVFPFPLSHEAREGYRGPLPSSAMAMLPLAQGCWERWRRDVDWLAFSRASAQEADGVIEGGLDGTGPWEVGWVPWSGTMEKGEWELGPRKEE